MLAKVFPEARDKTMNHVLELHDHFTITGPNGTHYVLVTEVVLPILYRMQQNTPHSWRKGVAQGFVLGVAQMHDRGVKHGGKLADMLA